MPYYLRIGLVSAALALLTVALVALAPRPQDVSVSDQAPIGSGVPVDAVVRVTFSRPVERSSAEASFRLVPVVAGRFTWEGETMIFTPQQPLVAGTNYNVTIKAGLRDDRGRTNRAETRWSFRTR